MLTFLTSEEVAQQLRITGTVNHKVVLARFRKQGGLPFYQFGKAKSSILYTQEDLDKWITNHRIAV